MTRLRAAIRVLLRGPRSEPMAYLKRLAATGEGPLPQAMTFDEKRLRALEHRVDRLEAMAAGRNQALLRMVRDVQNGGGTERGVS